MASLNLRERAPCHPQTQQASSGMEGFGEQKPGRSSSSLNCLEKSNEVTLSRVTPSGKPLSQLAQIPPQLALRTGTASSSPLSLTLLRVHDQALPARDNSISVQQIQTLIEFCHLKQGRNSSASLQS